MNISASKPTDNSPFTLPAAKDLLTALEAQDPAKRATVEFNQVLESTRTFADGLEVGTLDQAGSPDPTSSALFQAHSGSRSAIQVLADPDSALTLQQSSQLKVTGVDASSAAGPYANGQSLPPEESRAVAGGSDSVESSRYPAISGAGDVIGTYDSLRSAGQMHPPIGIRLDLQG